MLDNHKEIAINIWSALDRLSYLSVLGFADHVTPDWLCEQGWDGTQSITFNLERQLVEDLCDGDTAKYYALYKAKYDGVIADSLYNANLKAIEEDNQEPERVDALRKLNKTYVIDLLMDYLNEEFFIETTVGLVSSHELLLKILRDIRYAYDNDMVFADGRKMCANTGICTHIICNSVILDNGCLDGARRGSIAAMCRKAFECVATQWPEFSGNDTYPVPSHLYIGDAEHDAAYVAYEIIETKWEGEYGEARLRLLDFAIDYLEENIS